MNAGEQNRLPVVATVEFSQTVSMQIVYKGFQASLLELIADQVR